MAAAGKKRASLKPLKEWKEEDYDLDRSKVKLGPVLGRGAFSTVYKAEYNGMTLAVKKQEIADSDLERYIHKELAILRRCSHEGLVRYIGACKVDNTHIYIATEYCTGGDLRRLLQKDVAISWNLRVDIALGMAEAVTYLHHRQLIHRDIKTENVLLDSDLKPKLCDFGFARGTETHKGGRPMTMCGTDEFMAPEVIFGMEYNDKADIFGLGIIFAEMIARKVPGKEHAFLERHPMNGFNVDPDELEGLLATYKPPESFHMLCRECLAGEPDNRPSSEDVFDWLDDLRKELPPDTTPKPVITEADLLEADLAPIPEEEEEEVELPQKVTTPAQKRLTLAVQLAYEEIAEAFGDGDNDAEDTIEALGGGAKAKAREGASSKMVSRPPQAPQQARSMVANLRQQAAGGARKSRNFVMSGYVNKRGGRIKTWKKRFMVITGEGLVYFKTKDDFTKVPQEIQGLLPFSEMVALPKQIAVADEIRFVKPGYKNAFRVMTKKRERIFTTSDAKLSGKWVRAINLAYSTWCLQGDTSKKR
ncbi:RasGEF domain-containing serine/threonine-protein kinase X (Ras guanine nucleotide exchange factor X) (RasGEF domain-containing protein X) [Durusdinium trenchii]|uniref:RasGEF domain-containing serine/threonine-protein kinase X (Ras guanine nucleotide exchange factor X) (RasGEF domain-containing protein X) n=1 Tax=Durusdinium trenchii TaxID=1381693 RepID=A0ABP0HCF4_9DINO